MKKTYRKKLRPCDCKDSYHAELLNFQGISHNNESIITNGNRVTIRLNNVVEIKISRTRMKQFAEWFLGEQLIEGNNAKRIQIEEKPANTSTK